MGTVRQLRFRSSDREQNRSYRHLKLEVFGGFKLIGVKTKVDVSDFSENAIFGKYLYVVYF